MSSPRSREARCELGVRHWRVRRSGPDRIAATPGCGPDGCGPPGPATSIVPLKVNTGVAGRLRHGVPVHHDPATLGVHDQPGRPGNVLSRPRIRQTACRNFTCTMDGAIRASRGSSNSRGRVVRGWAGLRWDGGASAWHVHSSADVTSRPTAFRPEPAARPVSALWQMTGTRIARSAETELRHVPMGQDPQAPVPRRPGYGADGR